MELHEALELFVRELRRAEVMHPEFPSDPIHQIAILSEEAGEAVQAANNYVYERGDREALEREVVESGAMALRVLMNLR